MRVDAGKSPWSDIAVRWRREREIERGSSDVDFLGRMVVSEEIVHIRRSPSLGRCGRTLHPATSRRRSVSSLKKKKADLETFSILVCSQGHQSAAERACSRMTSLMSAVAFKTGYLM